MHKVCLGMASSDNVRAQTMQTLISLFKANPEMGFVLKQGPYVHDNRNRVVVDALNSPMGYTHLFFVDSDMKFKPEVLTRMLALDKDIVGAIYNKRVEPIEPVFTIRYDKVPTKPFVQPTLATGCLLIKMDVFKKVPQPWFFLGTAENQRGEDIYFCEKARENGFTLWCDPTVKVGHLGDYEY